MLGGLVAGLALAWGQRAVEAGPGPYRLPDGGTLECIAVCDIGSEATRCWNPKGEPMPDLAKRIEAQYLARPYGEVSIRVGRKTRYVVFRRSRASNVTYSSEGTSDHYVVGGAWSLFGNDEQFGVEWTRVSFEPNAPTFEITATPIRSDSTEPAFLPTAPGSSLEYWGTVFQVIGTKPVPTPARPPKQRPDPERDPSRYEGKRWFIEIRLQVLKNFGDPTTLQAVDAKGRVILYVDRNGKPVYPAPPPAPALVEKPLLAYHGSTGYGAETFGYLTNVDPAHIASIRLISQEKVAIRFTNLPAEPRPSP